MANDSKKYISLTRLSDFLDNIRERYSQIGHKHTTADLTDYTPITVDTALSPTSNNPVANSTLDAEFEAISQGMGALEQAIDNKADSAHNHDDIYYTDSEIDTKLASKSDTSHNHDSAYDAKGTAEEKAEETLASAKSYTDTKVSGLASTTVVDNKISSHNTSTSSHNDIRELISGLTTRLNTLANSDDTTLDQMSEVVDYIKNNKSLIDGITTSKVNVADIVNNLTTNVTNKPLSAAQGVAIKALIDALQAELDSHGHAIADVTGLQSALDGKAASSHGTHVTYGTAAPVMDGTASVGAASTVARSDHKHPTDTSRASKTEFDSHTGNTTVHITSTERTKWNTAATTAATAQSRADSAYTLAESKVDSLSDLGITATATELNYMDGVTSNVQTQLDELRNDVDAIPQSDWNQNDSTQLDFVKNRPFYTTDPVETVIAEGTIPANGMLQTSASINSLTLGEPYNVVFDGVAYNNLVCINYDGLPSLGNDAFMFAIQSGRAMAYAANSSASHTIKVMALLSSIVSLERKYIAEHIDNLAGEKVAGKSYTVDGKSVTAGMGAEVFNDYSTNIASGQYSHAEGINNIASDAASHAEGYGVKASGSYSHAEGYETTASGSRSHAEGWTTEATGQAAHSEGFATHATGQFSHSEGDNAIAEGRASHAEGYATDAIADYSHAEGMNTNASSEYQHVQGKYNVIDANDTYAHIVGNGTSNTNRKNAHTIDWSGNANFAGDVYVGNANTNKGGKKLATEEYVSNVVKAVDFPVDSVNGKTGAITLSASDVGALGVNGTAVNAEKLYNNWVTGSVLDFALSCPEGLTNFVTSTDTTDLPTWSNNYCYSTGLVMKRTNAFIYVELHPYNVKHNPIARNSYNNGSWYGWTYDYSEANKPTASDVGAAPAGYGLGLENGLYLDDCDKGTAFGLFMVGWQTANNPLSSYGALLVLPHNDTEKCQILTSSYNKSVLIRYETGGVWSEWVDWSPSAFAPAGYGLGTGVQAAPNNNPDDIVGTGFYKCVLPGVFGNDAWCIGIHEKLYDNSDDYAYQRFTSFAETIPRTVQRLKTPFGWSEWEWENPQMIEGREYRTTERVNGKAVYKKADSSGKILYRLDGETEWKSYSMLIGAAPAEIVSGVYGVSAEQSMDDIMNSVYTNMSNHSAKFICINNNIGGGLGGGSWHIELVRTSSDYGHAIATRYSGQYLAVYQNVMYEGAWQGWNCASIDCFLSSSGGTMSGYLDMNYNNITTLGWPEGDRDATPKKYVDDVVSGKLSLSGGTLTGDLSINNSINLSSSSQGGNIQIIPPSAYGVNYWEADAYNGNLRIFAQRNDSSYTFPLTLRSDGGIEISNAGCYGTSLPSAGTKGRIFFKKVSS